jgi:bifunctional non-homologous end joining protein LigD
LQASQAADPQDAAYAKKIAHKAIWVEPELLAEIEYRAKSAEGKVRHPFFKGLREDL